MLIPVIDSIILNYSNAYGIDELRYVFYFYFLSRHHSLLKNINRYSMLSLLFHKVFSLIVVHCASFDIGVSHSVTENAILS